MKRPTWSGVGRFAHRHHRLLIIIGAVLLCVVIVQLLYPRERTLPFARFGTEAVGNQPRNELAAQFQAQFDTSSVRITSGNRTETRKPSEVGVSLNADSMVAELCNYPLWQRFIPFTLLKTPIITTFHTTLSGQQVTERLGSLAASLSYEPNDATIQLDEGKLAVGTATNGRQVTTNNLRASLTEAQYRPGVTVVPVEATMLAPKRSDDDISTVKAEAEAKLARAIVVRIGSSTFTPDTKTKAAWLTIAVNESGQYVLSVNDEVVKNYASELNETVSVAPTATVVQVRDGVEVSRVNGANGAAISVDELAAQLRDVMNDSSRAPEITQSLGPVAPAITYERSYSSSEAGLRAFVDYMTSTQNVRIVVQQLDGAGWSASGREWESIPSASTYKLYVMMRVFDDINNNSLNWAAPMLDTDAGGCFERTIVVSTNPCAEEWIRRYGRDSLTDYVHSRGFSNGTGFTFRDATHTTAGDLARYMIGLYNGTLITGNNRDVLLEKMGRQLYRYGIPTGTKGWAQDKVGFLWDYIHDAAIVHHPRGTYVLVVMTKGYSYGYIANVTRQIESIMYP